MKGIYHDQPYSQASRRSQLRPHYCGSLDLPRAGRACLKDGRMGQAGGAFRLSIAADKEQYAFNEPIRISIVLKNVTDHEAWLIRTQRERFYDMEVILPHPGWIPWKPQAVLTPQGEALKHPHMGSFFGGKALAGSEAADEIWINNVYNMTLPGAYRVVFSCKEPLLERADPQVTITSNEFAVTVLPKTR